MVIGCDPVQQDSGMNFEKVEGLRERLEPGFLEGSIYSAKVQDVLFVSRAVPIVLALTVFCPREARLDTSVCPLETVRVYLERSMKC